MKTNFILFVCFTLLMSLALNAQSPTCINGTNNYSVDDPTGTTGSTYAWTILEPAFTGTITSGATPNIIDVDWAATPAGNYTIQVIETSADGCVGTPQQLVVTLNPLPAAPTVAADTSIVCPTEDSGFTITGIPGATVYYTLDGGATYISIVLDATGTGNVPVLGLTADTTIIIESIEDTAGTGCEYLGVPGVTATITVSTGPTTTPITAN